MRHYPAGKLFRLGRFEYKIEPFRQDPRLPKPQDWRDAGPGPDGVRYNGKGHVDGHGRMHGYRARWTAMLTEDEDLVTGY